MSEDTGSDTAATKTGGCLCGDIRYTLTGEPLFTFQCCCRDCRKATGTGHTTIIGFHQDQIEVHGDPATFTLAGDSGGEVTRHFCGRCGGRLYTSSRISEDRIMLQAGSLDDPDWVRPQGVLYAKDMVGWDHFDPDLPQYVTFPER